VWQISFKFIPYAWHQVHFARRYRWYRGCTWTDAAAKVECFPFHFEVSEWHVLSLSPAALLPQVMLRSFRIYLALRNYLGEKLELDKFMSASW
jgi:hypothetical protein